MREPGRGRWMFSATRCTGRWILSVVAFQAIWSCGPSNSPNTGASAGATKSVPAAATASASGATGATGDVQPAGPPGWSLNVAAAGAPAERQSRLYVPSASFALREGESLDPSVAAAGFVAGYSGVVAIDAPGRYRFAVQAKGGTARIAVVGGSTKLAELVNAGDENGLWTPWLNLSAKPVTVSVVFNRDGAQSARLRTLWEKEGTGSQGFVAEAIPTSSVSVSRFGQKDAAAAASALHGRVLLGELNCLSCHDAGEHAADVVTKRQAPLLGEICRRASPQWIARWVANPQKVKPGCGMPTILGESPGDIAAAENLTHFLVSLGGPTPPSPTVSADIDHGRKLYHTVGCVACHGAYETPLKVFGAAAALPDVMPDAKPPHPHGDLAGKWTTPALTAFLLDPHKTRPAGRMPSMSLLPDEANDIASYLVKTFGAGTNPGQDFKVDVAKAEAGKAAFASRGCANCHEFGGELPRMPSTLKARSIAELKDGGCLASDPGTPLYTLSEADMADLSAGITAVKQLTVATPVPSPLDRGHRLIAALGCRNCHTKDEVGGPPDSIKVYFRTSDDAELGDEGRLPPRLTGVGYKLRAEWIKKVLTDAGRARPYMTARMPQFGTAHVGDLNTALAAMDGVVAGSDAPGPPSGDEMLLAGRRLVGEAGLNCISCHTYSGKTAGTAGPEMTEFAQRLRYEWWKPYVLAPARYKPGTRMTAFYDMGRGKITDVFAGDPDRQTDALWCYFAAGKAAPAPEGLPTSNGLPVKVGARPSVFRSFMKDAGSRGIAVGYPIGIHFGFDAEQVRLVDAWQGDFVDATNTWKGRGGQIVSGQGQRIWSAPKGPPLVPGPKPESWPAKSGSEAEYAFKGYRFEPDGTPTFTYSIGKGASPLAVSERFLPRPREGVLLARDFVVTGLPPGQTVWLNAGKGAVQVSSGGTSKISIEKFSAADDVTWFGITAGDGPVGFTLEIMP